MHVSNTKGMQSCSSTAPAMRHSLQITSGPASCRTSSACILPRLLSILSRHYSSISRHFPKATWLDRQHSSGGPDQFSRVASGNETM